MATRALPTATIEPDMGTVWIDLTFPNTVLFCTYKLQLREEDSNELIPGYDGIYGDNENSEDDIHALPAPASDNDGRVLWAMFTVIDQTGDGGEYIIVLNVRQGGKIIYTKQIGPKSIEEDFDLASILLKFEIAEED